MSATVLSACDVLRAVGPVLSRHGVAFKGPATLDELRKLNSGIWYGYAQVGKFITVYPPDPDSFVSLCRRLHSLTCGLGSGPAIPFDIQYHPESKVYYRYGSFLPSRSTHGKRADFVYSPAGDPIEDRRDVQAKAPDWDEDPFKHLPAAAGPSDSGFLTRFKVFRVYKQRGKGGTYEAIDIKARPPRECVIKEGRRDGETGWDGRDGFRLVKNESKVLRVLGGRCAPVPNVYEMFEEDGNAYLALEKLDGVTLENFLAASTKPLKKNIAVHLARELVGLIAQIHSCGFVWRDCTPSNLIVNRDGRLSAIDFEGSCSTSKFEPISWSTPDYSPPEIRKGFYEESRGSNVAEDLFALGCCLYLLFEGRHPALDRESSSRPVFERLQSARISEIIRKLLSVDPDERPGAAGISRSIRL